MNPDDKYWWLISATFQPQEEGYETTISYCFVENTDDAVAIIKQASERYINRCKAESQTFSNIDNDSNKRQIIVVPQGTSRDILRLTMQRILTRPDIDRGTEELVPKI